MKRRGYTMIELLVAVLVIGLVMSAILTTFISMWKSQGASVGMSSSQAQAQQMATTLCNAFRGAALCASTDSGCVVGANVQDATATSCKLYTRDSSGVLGFVTYAVNNGNFQMTVGIWNANYHLYRRVHDAYVLHVFHLLHECNDDIYANKLNNFESYCSWNRRFYYEERICR